MVTVADIVADNGVVHVKYFMRYEDYSKIISYEQYKISSQGKFMRYYEKDGVYTTEFEYGQVKNNVRDGIWIEKKGNYLAKGLTYLEANYKEGIAEGDFKYYKG